MNDIQIRILDLQKSTDAKAFNKEEVLHLNEFERVLDWITKDIEAAQIPDERRSSIDRDRRHDTITILGTRGSGKTSFILSILTHLEKAHPKTVEVLDIIDPTLIEEKGHIFLDVFSSIKDKVDTALEKQELGISNEENLQRGQWHELIDKLAHGLPNIDGIGGNLTDAAWQDPEYIMQRGLRSVKAARELEKNFTKAISVALKILKKQAFVIAFDDIDIDFKKGWPVLELLRKYFVSKQLITILSGDMRLYSLSVRKRQWHNFGEDLLKYEASTPMQLERIRELVIETESQYLQKVMKPVRRVHLTTLQDKLRIYPGTRINVVNSENNFAPIQDVYQEIFNIHGIYNSYQVEIYRSFLLNSPIRMQIRFLEANILRAQKEKSSFIDPFISDLYEFGIDVDNVFASPQQLNIGILELLMREKILSETCQLQPITTKPSLNGALTGLTLLFSQSSQSNPSLSFDYFLRIGYIRNLLSSLHYEGKYLNDRSIRPSLEDLCRHSGLLQDRVIKDNIGMVTSYMIAVRSLNGNKDRPWAGIIPLRSLAGRGRLDENQKRTSIDVIAGKIDPIKRALIYFPLSISQSTLQQSGTVVYSFHMLLATITEFIRKAKHGDLFRGIGELSQIRSYPMPDFDQAKLHFDDINEQTQDSNHQGSSSNAYGILEDMIKAWVNQYPDRAIAPHLLGKISTRFFFAADTIQNIQREEKLGEVMHALTVSFLNSVLIEEIKERIPRPNINLNNPRFSSRIFTSNLKNTSLDMREKLDFSRWIFTCPLLIPYLDPKSSLINQIIDFGNGDFTTSAVNYSVYHDLMEIEPKIKLTKPNNYDLIIGNLQSIGRTDRMVGELDYESDFDQLLAVYRSYFPNQKLSAIQLRKVLDYNRMEDRD